MTTQRFIDNGDGTITDTLSGLMWSQATIAKDVTSDQAEKACDELDLAGHADWRLPTVEELFPLADRSKKGPAIDTEFFPDTKNGWYWTSTDSALASSYAWVVSFNYGYAGDNSRNGKACVRAVRSITGE